MSWIRIPHLGPRVSAHTMESLARLAKKRKPGVDLNKITARCTKCGATLTAIGLFHYLDCDAWDQDIVFAPKK